jgi:hypothetical protein
MSLAYFAASIDDDTNMTLPETETTNCLHRKRMNNHKKTQRTYPKIENSHNFNTNKVNSVLEKIHNNNDEDEDEDNNGLFQPPPKPESVGVLKTNLINESFSGMTAIPLANTAGKSPTPNYEGSDNLDLNNYNNYGNSKTNEDYYKNVLSGYNANNVNANKPHYAYREQQQPHNDANYLTQDVLLKKLNYMITLLEDQQDEKTNNVTEEIILYSFLGIFIIFMADTFVRAGKYTR